MENVNWAYSDFFQKLNIVIDIVAPCKTKRIKGNTLSWFDGEVLELRSSDKLFKLFQKNETLQINKELYKKAK